MFTPEIYKGIVIDNKDLAEKGRLQIQVLPELKDVEENLLPWMRPFMYQDVVNSPLEIGAHVWCIFIDQFWKDGYWISGQFIDGFYDYEEILASISSITGIDSPDYPQPFFKKYSDGTVLFHNELNSESGILSPSGSNIIFDKTGNIILSNSANRQTISPEFFKVQTSNIIELSSIDGMNSLIMDASKNSVNIVAVDQIYNKTKYFGIEASSKKEKIGDVVLNYTNLEERTISGKTETVGGNKVLTIAGNSQELIKGDYENNVFGGFKISVNNPLKTVEINYLLGAMKIQITALGIVIDAGLLPVSVKGSLVFLG